jgi:hypothetical protein
MSPHRWSEHAPRATVTTPPRFGAVVSILLAVLLLACGKSGAVANASQASDAKSAPPVFHEPYVFTDIAAGSKGTVADTGVFAQGSWVSSPVGGVLGDNASMVRCSRPNQVGVSGAGCEVFYATVGPLTGMILYDYFEVERCERDEVVTQLSSETFLKARVGAPACAQFRIHIDREAREVTAIGSPVPAGCPENAENAAPVLRLYQRADMPIPES